LADGDAERRGDLVLIAFFLLNLLVITYVVDLEQLVIADPTHFTYPLWPPRVAVDAIHWYGYTFDHDLIARPVWWKMTIWIDNLGFGPYVSASAGRSERLRQGVHRLICLTEDNQRPRSLYEQRFVLRRLHQSRVGREDCQRPLEVGSGLGIGVQQERLSPSCRCVAHCGCPHPGGLRVACQFSGRDPVSCQRAQRLPVKHLPPRCGDTGIDRLTHEIVWKAQEALVLKQEPTRC